MRLLALTLLLASFCSLPVLAKDKHLPLSPQMMNAKTVYIDNRSGNASLGDRAYQELLNWGRFRVVQDRTQADVIFLLSLRVETRGARNTGRVDENGNYYGRSSPNIRAYSGLTVLDAKTGDPLWTESKVATIFRKSAIKRAVDELRKRMEEQSEGAAQ